MFLKTNVTKDRRKRRLTWRSNLKGLPYLLNLSRDKIQAHLTGLTDRVYVAGLRSVLQIVTRAPVTVRQGYTVPF